MKKYERHNYIVSWFKRQKENSQSGIVTADVLNSEFVWDYVNATGVTVFNQPYGAPKCAHLGKDLAELYRRGILIRYSVGLMPGSCIAGFPRWVYVYELNEKD